MRLFLLAQVNFCRAQVKVRQVTQRHCRPFMTWRAWPGGGTGCSCRTSLASTAVQLAGGSTAPPAPLDTPGWHVAGWMEWEEFTLRPAVYGTAPGPLEAALAHLDRCLAASEFLVGSAPTLADVVVFAGLLPLTVASATVRSPPRQAPGTADARDRGARLHWRTWWDLHVCCQKV